MKEICTYQFEALPHARDVL